MSMIKITDNNRIGLPKTSISENDISTFKNSLMSYIDKIKKAIDDNENEEHIKNIINSFLSRTFYNDEKYSINTDGYIDSAIKENGKLLAIIEAKAPQNKPEMITVDNINRKALWEAFYYFLEKTIDVTKSKAMISTTAEVRRLIITDGINWFLIDSSAAHAVTDGNIERRYWQYKNGKLPYSNDTSAFYEELRQQFEKMDIMDKLEYIYFNIEDCAAKKQNITALYKILSENYLLKNSPRINYEPHSLNNNFYHELLYIMGLKEIQKDNKLVVEIDPTIKNSLSDQVYSLLRDREIDDEKNKEITFELVLIWINRLLFIKLFEAQLISFNSDIQDYHILSNDKITSFGDLQNLFFDVLGTKERSESAFHNKFDKIPYLNSSLFEKQKLETEFILISYLHNEKIERKQKTVLGKKYKSNPVLLEYIIDFLNSYNFSSIDNNDVSDRKEIIDAAVLGLIFEKLNGYKDGANYTPSVITEYLAKEAVESAVINAVNSEMNWKCADLSDVADKIESRDERVKINNIINSLKICDPAVGSGHFLVSVLNRVIAVKKQLGVLFKYNSAERVKEYDIVVEDDVLVVRYGNGNPFVYNKNNNESREIQATLFNEKRIIIENCLFGVDVNSKAVYICQLRLWIELLKNAYYEKGVMETLPNIDINIKVGNSVLSKIDFVIGKKIKTDKDTGKLIARYKELVSKYKSVTNKAEKKTLLKELTNTKEQVHGLYEQFSFFDTVDFTYDSAFEWSFEFPEILDENGKFTGFDIVIGNPPYIQLQKIQEEANKLQKMNYQTYERTGDIYCLFYELAHKLLKPNGYLAFVTSNKWMRAGYGEALRNFLNANTNPLKLIDFAGERVFDSATVDVNILIFQKCKNQHKTASCIIKDSGWRNNLSVYFQQNAEDNCFDNSASWVILSPIEQSIKRKIESIGVPLKDWDISINYGIKTGFNDAFIISGEKKDELISADPKSAEIIRPILRGRDIKKYSFEHNDSWLIFVPWHFPLHKDSSIQGISKEAEFMFKEQYPAVYNHLLSFKSQLSNRNKAETGVRYEWYALQRWGANYSDDFSRQKIVWKRVGSILRFCYDDTGCFCLDSTCFAVGENIKFLTLVLNSPLGKFLLKDSPKTGTGDLLISVQAIEPICIPIISDSIKKEFENYFDNLYIGNKNHNDTEEIEKVITQRIFDLYNFDEKESNYIRKFQL